MQQKDLGTIYREYKRSQLVIRKLKEKCWRLKNTERIRCKDCKTRHKTPFVCTRCNQGTCVKKSFLLCTRCKKDLS